MENTLPSIPAKRYFTIGEVGDLCGVKPHVLRYWEQEFTQLRPMKRRGNLRYYQHHEVLLIRRIRDLLYDQGFTISGARNRLNDGALRADLARSFREEAVAAGALDEELREIESSHMRAMQADAESVLTLRSGPAALNATPQGIREALLEIRSMLLAEG